MESTKKRKQRPTTLSAFTIILIITFILGIISHFLPEATFTGEKLVSGSGVVGATLSQILMAPILGFADAIDIAVFILVLGGFLKIINHTKYLICFIKLFLNSKL